MMTGKFEIALLAGEAKVVTCGTPEITVNRSWSVFSVRSVCVENELYTEGSNEEYEKMFAFVRQSFPTPENLYIAAKDICEHSKAQTISNVMFMLEKDAVVTTFEIEGEER